MTQLGNVDPLTATVAVPTFMRGAIFAKNWLKS
jgi:hypothetical protein